MARTAQDDFVALSHEGSAPASREPGAREHEIELGRRSHERVHRCRVPGDERRQVAQDPHDLVALCRFGLSQPVRVVDRGERLDEKRLARAGGVVHDSRHASAGRCLQRQNGTTAALGDEVVLEVLGERRIAGDLAETLGQSAAAFAELAPEAAKRRRGRIAQIGSVLLDRASDLVRDREQQGVDRLRKLRQGRDPGSLRERPAGCHAGADRALHDARASECRARSRGPRAPRPRSRPRRRGGRARRSRRAARSPRSSVAGGGRTCSSSADGRRATASRAPGSLAAASESRARTAGSSSSSRSCSRMARVYDRAARCTAVRTVLRSCGRALPRLPTAAGRDGVALRRGDGDDTPLRATASICRASPRSRCSSTMTAGQR